MAKLNTIQYRTRNNFDRILNRYDAMGENVKFNPLGVIGAKEKVFFSDEKEWNFYVLNNNVLSSIKKPIVENDNLNVKTVKKVKSETLNSWISKNNTDWDFLTVEQFGYSINVLMGASDYLNQFVAIEIRDVSKPYYENEKTINDSIKYLESHDYSLFRLDENDCNVGVDTCRAVLINSNSKKTSKIATVKAIFS